MKLYQTPSKDRLMNNVLPRGGNMQIGFPQREIVYSVTNDELALRGVPINIYTAEEYKPLQFRCKDGAAYEALNHGVQGVYNITRSDWVTSDISSVDTTGTVISFNTAKVYADDKCIVYYYGIVPASGGMAMSMLPGQETTPAVADNLMSAWNDSVPVNFGTGFVGDSSDTNIYKYQADIMYRTTRTVTIGNRTTMIESNTAGMVTGSWRVTGYPLYLTELCIKTQTGDPFVRYLNIYLTVDSHIIHGYMDTGYDLKMWNMNSLSNPLGALSGGGGLYDAVGGDAMGVDAYTDGRQHTSVSDTFHTWVFDLGELEVLDNLKLEILYHSVTGVSKDFHVYFRGWGVLA